MGYIAYIYIYIYIRTNNARTKHTHTKVHNNEKIVKSALLLESFKKNAEPS